MTVCTCSRYTIKPAYAPYKLFTTKDVYIRQNTDTALPPKAVPTEAAYKSRDYELYQFRLHICFKPCQVITRSIMLT